MTDSTLPSPEPASDPPASCVPSPASDVPSPARDVARFRRALHDFFAERARPLPWRECDDPYAIWVSEIMLQQTRVETVVPYWERWMACFPTPVALAEAEESEVLKAWEGLGYYSRARNLRRGAIVVRERFGGVLPSEPAALLEVPGIGPYTAGAVASIAFGVPAPAVDGNVRRVLARLFDEAEPSGAWLRERATELLDPERPGDFNEALMELGATVCTPRSPRCSECPVATSCAARTAGTAEGRPAPKRTKPVPEREVAVRVEVRSGPEGRCEVRMRRRPSEGLLGGLWEFPPIEPGGESEGVEGDPLEPVAHAYSHFTATYRPFARVVGPGGDARAVDDGGGEGWIGEAGGGEDGAGESGVEAESGGAEEDGETWIDFADLADLALPVAQRKIADAVAVWLADRVRAP